MRYLIFSDIHGNLEALQSVLEDAAGRNFGSVVCLGDFVGYGSDPNECVRMLAGMTNLTAVLGNHDAAVFDPAQREFFNPVAQAGVIYSERHTDAATRDFLMGLPLMVETDDRKMIAVHASPFRPDSWIYLLDREEAVEAFEAMALPVAFIGHTHFPAVHTEGGLVSPFLAGEQIRLNGERKRIVNVGSVGQPRDGDPRASYVIFDAVEQVAELFRIAYDVDKAASKILRAGLPPILAERLRRGY